MKIDEQIINKIEKFYLLFPEEEINEAIEKAFNRVQLRSIEKGKNIEEKIRNIIKKEVENKQFILQIGKKYDVHFAEEFDVKEVIDTLNTDNFVSNFLKILSKLYSDDSVREYIKSNEFEQIYSKYSDINNNNNSRINKYIVHIEERNSFYNIFPIFEIKNNKLRMVESNEFPDYGNIPIHPYYNFSQKNYLANPLWICKFTDDELLDNTEYGLKVEGAKYAKVKFNGDDLIKNNSIYEIDKEEIYEIVDVNGDILKDEIIEIAQEPITEQVCIIKSGFIYGPFKYVIDKNRNKFYITKKNTDYILKRYSIELNKEYIHIYEDVQDNIKSYYSSITITLAYFADKKNISAEEVDTINDVKLVDSLINNLQSRQSINISDDKINEVKNIFSLVNDSLPKSRIEKLKEYLNNVSVTNSFVENELSKILEGLLSNEDTKDFIADILIKNKEIGQRLENVKSVDDEINNKKNELNNIEMIISSENEKLESIRKKINEAKNETISEELNNTESELNNIRIQLNKKKNELAEIDERYKLYNDLDNAKKMYKEFKEKAERAKDEYSMRIKDLSDQQKKLDNYEKTIEEKINSKLNSSEITYSIADNTFSEIVADEMIKFSSNRREKIEESEIEKKVATKDKVNNTNGIRVKKFNEDNLIDYIYNNMSKYRNYEKNDIINMLICISQGFLTVFAGEPGVGKTTTCNYIARSMGLINNTDYLRYNEVSVEKGWTSKRDLIGYYNPLTKTFNKNNSRLFETFSILKNEAQNKIFDFPYFVLLDEANLSSMEYYWADFMNTCDLGKAKRTINLGEEYVFEIPKTLRFLATINYDHTTEILSPRLIDRAWIILLESDMQNVKDMFLERDTSSTSYIENELDDKIILYDDFIKDFSIEQEDKLSATIIPIIQSIYKEFNDFKFNISPRVNKMIKDYVIVGSKLFDTTGIINNKEIIALDYAVAQKLLPKISGEGIDFKEKFLTNLKKIFDNHSMLRCKNIIEKIISKGDLNMQYYQFFI